MNFTQFYAAPLYLNPALTGTTPHFRLSTLYRIQWPNLPGSYQVNAFAFDYNLDEYNSGLGLTASQDRAGAAGLRSTQFSAHYSYQINLTQSLIARAGLQAGFTSRSVDFSKLVFEDQLASGGPTREQLSGRSLNYLDFGTGLLIYNERFWFGASVFHLSRPSQGFIYGSERLAMRQSVHAGVKIPLDGGDGLVAISPSIAYHRQKPFDMLDFGVNFQYDPLFIGARYRGLPIRKNARGNVNQDAIAAVVGVKPGNFTFAYSYDFTISSLRGSGGSHEISIIYEPKQDLRYKRGTKHIQCPAF